MLAKVNTDQYPEVSQQFGIRGIPAVKLFVDGQVVNEFTGALPEPAVRKWLDEALPTQEKQQLAFAEQAYEMGDVAGAESMLRGILRGEPDNGAARLLLARIVALRAPDEALALIEGVDASAGDQPLIVESIKTLAGLRQQTEADFPDGEGKPVFLHALQALHQEDYETALTSLILILQKDRYYHEDAARKAGVALFTLLGPAHEATRKHRRTFDMWLY